MFILVGAKKISQKLTKFNYFFTEGGKFRMIPQWSGEIVGKIHQNGIKQVDLAAYLGFNPKYLSQILNGKATPKKAEAVVRRGLDEMIAAKESHTEPCEG